MITIFNALENQQQQMNNYRYQLQYHSSWCKVTFFSIIKYLLINVKNIYNNTPWKAKKTRFKIIEKKIENI